MRRRPLNRPRRGGQALLRLALVASIRDTSTPGEPAAIIVSIFRPSPTFLNLPKDRRTVRP